ncbi:MAG: ribbon-helix-helix protein, CopG family, partial [Candidatus Brockarchaeota archaeon]|nr:ribbon-helix-helix protein, CopG family [Candidatus Brockarchaeota archaeon]
MQRTVKQKIVPVRFDEEELEAIDGLLNKVNARSRSEFIREAVKHYLDTVREIRVIQIRNVSKAQARREILKYLKERKEADTFDIANDLKLDLGLTIRVLKEL